MHEKWYSRNYKSMPVRGIYRMKEKLRLLLRKPAVIALLIAELLVIGFALAAALRPAAAYTFTADQWESIAQESKIGYDEDGRIGVTEMTDGEDILQTPPMTLPKGHYTATLDYRYVPSVWEGGVERRSCLYFTSAEAGTVTGEKPCIDVKKQQDSMTLNVSDYSETVRLVAHNDGGIFTLGTVCIEQDMLYAGACAAGWLVLFVLLDAFLLLTVPGSPVRLADSELCACLWVLCAVAVLTCAPALTSGGAGLVVPPFPHRGHRQRPAGRAVPGARLQHGKGWLRLCTVVVLWRTAAVFPGSITPAGHERAGCIPHLPVGSPVADGRRRVFQPAADL